MLSLRSTAPPFDSPGPKRHGLSGQIAAKLKAPSHRLNSMRLDGAPRYRCCGLPFNLAGTASCQCSRQLPPMSKGQVIYGVVKEQSARFDERRRPYHDDPTTLTSRRGRACLSLANEAPDVLDYIKRAQLCGLRASRPSENLLG